MTNSLKSICLLLFSLAIGSNLRAADIYVVNSESRTLSHIDTTTGQINNVFCQLGLTPNRCVVDAEYIYVTLSGDNAVQMISRQTGQSLRYISVAASCNPWDIAKAGNYLYVSGLFTNRVYKISLQSFSVVDQITVGIAPEALLTSNGKLFVTNTGGYQSGYANSSVSVIDLESFTVTTDIPVWHNPQYLIQVGDFIHVSCTGNWTNLPGKVAIVSTITNSLEQHLEIGGNPGGLWESPNGIVYLGDGMNTGVYSYDAQNLAILHNAANPLIPGGIAIGGTDSFVAVLNSLWGQNGTVSLRNADFSLQNIYTVALAPTDLQVYAPPTVNDDLVTAVHPVQMYPNPVKAGNPIHFTNLHKSSATLQVYNLRGQLIAQTLIQGDKATWRATDDSGNALSAGIYFYRLNGVVTGKFLVL